MPLQRLSVDHDLSVTRSVKVPDMKKEHWLLIAAGAGGALIWILISTASGRKEAWDSELYFSIGMPAVCLLAALLGFLEPKRTSAGVRALARQFGDAVYGGPGNLLPLGIIVFGVLAIPPILVALGRLPPKPRCALKDASNRTTKAPAGLFLGWLVACALQ
jgi:hypothetical protein